MGDVLRREQVEFFKVVFRIQMILVNVALLVEHRTLTLQAENASRELALEWKAEFEVGRKTNEVTLTGAHYHGLGMRFLKELDTLAQHSYAGRKPDLSNSRQETSPTKWASVSFAAPGAPATIVLVPHPFAGHSFRCRCFARLSRLT